MKGAKTMGCACCELEDGCDNTLYAKAKVCVAMKPPKCVWQFDEIESAGTEVTYIFLDCRGCLKCKSGTRLMPRVFRKRLIRA